MALKIQSRPLTDDQQYTLDGSLESSFLDSGSAGLIQIYADRDEFDRVLGNVRAEYGYGLKIGEALMGLADRLFHEASPAEKMQATACGLVFARWQARRTSWHIATWAITDIVEGGCEVNHHPIRAERDLLTPTVRDYRRLQSPRWIKRKIRRNEEANNWRRHVQRLMARYGRPPETIDIRAGSKIFTDAVLAQRARERERELAFWREIYEGEAAGIRSSTLIASRSARKQATRKYRKIIKKAARTAVAVVGQEGVSKFARGEPVIMEGKDLDIQVKRAMRLGTLGHGALDVAVLDKETQKSMASLCVYFEKTPALDQLTAIKMHLDTGIEDEFLRDANLINVTTEGAIHPILLEKKQQREVITAQVRDLDEIILRIESKGVEDPRTPSFDDRRKRNEDYWHDTQGLWIPPTETYVLGHRVLKLMGEESYGREIEDYTG